jgi:hypothetical protein
LTCRIGEEIAVSSWIPFDRQRIDVFAHRTDGGR